jgi:hypothetical protein
MPLASSRRDYRDDSGFGLILVVALSVVITLFVALSLTLAQRTISSGRSHTTYNQSLDASESGVDLVLGQLKTNHSYAAGPDLPAQCWTSGLTLDSPCGTDERAWVRLQLSSLATTSSNRVRVSQGEFVAIKPAHAHAVYSMSFVPDYAHATRIRVLKAEYLFSTFAPADAILTGSSSNISGSFTVSAVLGSPPASIHSNQDLTQCPNLSISAGGTTSASGLTNACGGTAQSARETIPAIDPRAVYTSEWSKYSGTWFDLCPDGKAYQPSAAGPCSGQAQGSASPLFLGNSPFRSWSFGSGTWNDGGGSNSSGIFYVYRADANMTRAGSVIQTVLTEATMNRGDPTTQCAKNPNDGNITIKQTDVTTFMPGLVILAGNSLSMQAQSGAGVGLVAAQETVSMNTSSAPGVQGAVIAENYCDSTANPEVNSFQGSEVRYDGSIDVPLGSTVRTSLELEL